MCAQPYVNNVYFILFYFEQQYTIGLKNYIILCNKKNGECNTIIFLLLLSINVIITTCFGDYFDTKTKFFAF